MNSCSWINTRQNLIITGTTGIGKTLLACALGNQVCRRGFSVYFLRLPLLYEELKAARDTGTLRKTRKNFVTHDLLILGDFGIGIIDAHMRADFLELIECRSDGKSTLVTSQLLVSTWHNFLSGGNKTTADAILDRIVSGSHRLELSGDNMRQVKHRK